MGDEDVGEFDAVPEVLPHLVLRGVFDVHKIRADFDVGSVDDFDIGTGFAEEGDEAGHLRVIDDDDVGAARCERPAGGKPVLFGVVRDPFFETFLFVLVEADGGGGDALEDVVVGFGDAEDGGVGLGDVPVLISVNRSRVIGTRKGLTTLR